MKKCPNCGFENASKINYSHTFNQYCEYFVESIKQGIGFGIGARLFF